ncbi:putative membrane protein [Leptospira fainei serovar Hurstbridge str. BUT 6]|uniref:Membrane protein n=1 Tax=Leptospira fainei serovar Hurstbridge str. BUT 6 TaxID=1193011 RepID=S3UPV0_9LEPT|nr:membrane protein [Leptospira fainei]EPG72431.1 putative membrane protein [Leptospira fainei serovar Hurstbridge str. BUT 6]
MLSIQFVETVAILFSLFFGVYVFKISPTSDLNRRFLTLCILISLWIGCFLIRDFLPLGIRPFAFDWMLLPSIFIPSTLNSIVRKLKGEVADTLLIQKAGSVAHVFLLGYFVYCAVFCKFSVLIDSYNFYYRPTFNYHLLLIYATTILGLSILNLGNRIRISKGLMRVRMILLLSGISVSLFFALVFIYLLPLFQIFYVHLVSIGIILFLFLWAIAILHYDAFAIKDQLLSGKKIPFLIRASLPAVLLLYHLADPRDYDKKLLDTRSQIASSLIEFNYELVARTSLEGDEKSRVIAEQFGRYFK